MFLLHRAARTAAITLGATTLVVLGGTTASAHVTVTPSTTSAGAYAVLTFASGHGCDGSATTSFTFDIPEPIVSVTPTMKANWTVEKVMEESDTAEGSHGAESGERVAQVVYTAKTALADGFRETFELSLQLPDSNGQKLAFPVLQACEEGETAWVQTYDDGQAEPDHPAPFLEVTAGGDGGGHHGGDAHADEETVASDSSGSTALGWAGVVLGLLGLGAGATALGRGRTRA